MKKKSNIVLGIYLLAGVLLTGCKETSGGRESKTITAERESTVPSEFDIQKESGLDASVVTGMEKMSEGQQEVLPDGIYTADFYTDSSMFHVSEASGGKGLLTVSDGEMTIHISLGSKKIVNLYPGPAEEAEKEGAELLQPVVDTVTYSDGMTEEVYGFDVPVPGLDKEFDLALIGTKGKWYDHKVSVSNPEETGEKEAAEKEAAGNPMQPKDGTYSIEIDFEGGSGRAKVLSPAKIQVSEGKATAAIQWSSPDYDYMIVGGETYYPVNTEGNSVFEFPVETFDTPMEVIGDTLAMSVPHEIKYTLIFYSDTMLLEPKGVLSP